MGLPIHQQDDLTNKLGPLPLFVQRQTHTHTNIHTHLHTRRYRRERKQLSIQMFYAMTHFEPGSDSA